MSPDGTEVRVQPHHEPDQTQALEPDYKTLLLKYIEHVGRNSGLSFLSTHQRGTRDQGTSFKDTTVFTDEEWAVMKHLDQDRTFRSFHLSMEGK